jgi:hypothetical protein
MSSPAESRFIDVPQWCFEAEILLNEAAKQLPDHTSLAASSCYISDVVARFRLAPWLAQMSPQFPNYGSAARCFGYGLAYLEALSFFGNPPAINLRTQHLVGLTALNVGALLHGDHQFAREQAWVGQLTGLEHNEVSEPAGASTSEASAPAGSFTGDSTPTPVKALQACRAHFVEQLERLLNLPVKRTSADLRRLMNEPQKRTLGTLFTVLLEKELQPSGPEPDAPYHRSLKTTTPLNTIVDHCLEKIVEGPDGLLAPRVMRTALHHIRRLKESTELRLTQHTLHAIAVTSLRVADRLHGVQPSCDEEWEYYGQVSNLQLQACSRDFVNRLDRVIFRDKHEEVAAHYCKLLKIDIPWYGPLASNMAQQLVARIQTDKAEPSCYDLREPIVTRVDTLMASIFSGDLFENAESAYACSAFALSYLDTAICRAAVTITPHSLRALATTALRLGNTIYNEAQETYGAEGWAAGTHISKKQIAACELQLLKDLGVIGPTNCTLERSFDELEPYLRALNAPDALLKGPVPLPNRPTATFLARYTPVATGRYKSDDDTGYERILKAAARDMMSARDRGDEKSSGQ